MQDLLDLSALELAAHIRLRELSSLEATRFFLERIERLNPELQAFVSLHRRRALWTAARCDRVGGRRRERPLFFGVPTGVKDLVPVFGSFTRLGSRAYRWFVSPYDAPGARRLRHGGFVFLGKLATSEFGALPVTEPDIHPPTKNPWDLRRTPGGSSGGSASAVAAGLLPIAQGSDGGGSIRIPSAFCGLFGFKPSLSLLGNLHGRVNILGMSVMGALARTVEDSAAMLDVLRDRPFPRAPHGPPSCLSAAGAPLRPLRIGWSSESPLGGAVDPEIVRATEDTATLLASLGHHVDEIRIERGTIDEFLPLWQLMLAAVPSPGDGRLQPITRWLREAGRSLTLEEVLPTQRTFQARIDRMFGVADVVLTPTVPFAPPLLGSPQGPDPRQAFFEIAQAGAFTAAFNATDRPAASLPAGLSSAGLPLAIQLGGRRGEDHLLLALSRQVEQARPWRQWRAPLS